MLEQIREFANKRIVKYLFAIFLVIPFGLFGIDFYFRNAVGGDIIATVGPAAIGSTEFDQALRQQADFYRQQFRGQFDQSLMDNPEIRRAVLDRLVNEKIAAVGSERAGIRMGDKQLANKIASEPVFQVGGRFSKERDVFNGMSVGVGKVNLRRWHPADDRWFRCNLPRKISRNDAEAAKA